MSIIVYCAANLARASEVPAWHDRLTAIGCTASDAWANVQLPAMGDVPAIRAAVSLAEEVVRSSHLVLAFGEDGAPEVHHTARFAADSGIPVLWVGPPTLGLFRAGVGFNTSQDDAFGWLKVLADASDSSFGLYVTRAALRDRIT